MPVLLLMMKWVMMSRLHSVGENVGDRVGPAVYGAKPIEFVETDGLKLGELVISYVGENVGD